MSRVKKKRRVLPRLLILGVLIYLISLLIPRLAQDTLYKREYKEYVNRYSAEYEMDENFIYAVIRTESNFNPDAQSDAGAVGLMQIMNIAFVEVRDNLMNDTRGLTYTDMSQPEYNIEYGTCLLSYLYGQYHSYELTAAAYHAGITTVNGWIADGIIDEDDVDVEDIPSDSTQHYVNKVMRAYKAYSNLYSEEYQ